MIKRYEEVISARLISRTEMSGRSISDIVVWCARVSNPESQAAELDNDRLIKYLLKNKHWSPFEMVDLTLDVKVARDIGRQILRHKFNVQEFSQRYADPMGQDEVFCIREFRTQDHNNRQNSIECPEFNAAWKGLQLGVVDVLERAKAVAVPMDCAKEVFRCILPEGMTMSRLLLKNSLRGWIHYLQVRTKPGTQKEHRQIAELCLLEIEKEFPLIREIVNESN